MSTPMSTLRPLHIFLGFHRLCWYKGEAMQTNDPIKAVEAAKILGVEFAALRKRCQRGSIPGAEKRFDGGQESWFIPAEYVQANKKTEIIEQDRYDQLYLEWIQNMEKGYGHKKPVSPNGIFAYTYGIEKFWLYVEDPPKVIKPGRRKGEEKAVPKRKPNIHDFSLDNLLIAISNVPINREEMKCHFSLKEKIYLGFRSFYKFLISKGLRTKAGFAELDEAKPVRIFEEVRDVLTESQLIKLLEANRNLITGRLKDNVDFDIQCTELLIYLSAIAGLRNEEMVDLQVSHINLQKQELNVIDGKGNKNRQVGINEDLRDRIAEWLEFYRPKTRFPNLMVSAEGRPLTTNQIYRRILRPAKQAGIKINPHGLRRTCASLALEADVPLHHISENFGHTRVSTTEKSYISRNKREAVNSFKKFRPELKSSERTIQRKAPSNSARMMQQLEDFSALESF